MGGEDDRGRAEVLGLVVDLEARVAALRTYIEHLVAGDPRLEALGALLAPGDGHWHAQPPGTLEALAVALVNRRTVDPGRVLDEYIEAWVASRATTDEFDLP